MQLYIQFKEIPRKVIVAKRLAQCLNPALPTGVHQRALDVYSHVLAVLGVRCINICVVGFGSAYFQLFIAYSVEARPSNLVIWAVSVL